MAIQRRHGKKWQDVSPARKKRIMFIGMVQVSLLIIALLDLKKRPESEINGNKKMWLGLVFINGIGPISYFLFGRKRG